MCRAKWKATVGLVCLVMASALLLLADATPMTSASDLVEPVGEIYGVIVGVSGYLHIDDLNTPDDGARQMAHQLQDIWGKKAHLRLLLNQDATRNRIGEAIYWLASSVDEDDLTLFYFTGHGGADGLAPHDAQRDSSSHDITPEVLDRWLDALSSKRVIVIIDSCKAGGYAMELARSGRVVLASCGENRDARGELSNRIAQALLEPGPLDLNSDGMVSAEELLNNIARQVRSQQPCFFDGCPGDLQLVSITAPAARPA
jgi:hypothetical protein